MGTLLDLSALDGQFRAQFGDTRVRQEWFSEVLKLALAITARGSYETFSDITEAALKIVEERHGHQLSSTEQKKILESLRALPPFGDVKPGLERLKSHGFKLVVLTNSRVKAAQAAVKFAGLRDFFDKVLSAEDVKRLKPAPEPYRMAAKKTGVKPSNLLLVATHSWDVAGAMRTGCRGAFVRRPEQVLDELTPRPDFNVADLIELARILGL